MATWNCIDRCGACCHLDPSDRPDLDRYLTPAELSHYLGMVGKDGWCINFNHLSRICNIYRDRPRFCRVEPQIFIDMYQIAPEEFTEFAIDCCFDQIESVYGDRSLEQLRYEQAIES
jgi:uncharacterized protein